MNMQECVPGTTVTRDDLILLGGYVLNYISVMSQMGHVSPAMSTVYVDPGADPMARLFHDMLLTCAFGGDADAHDRICRFVDESGWIDRIANEVTR